MKSKEIPLRVVPEGEDADYPWIVVLILPQDDMDRKRFLAPWGNSIPSNRNIFIMRSGEIVKELSKHKTKGAADKSLRKLAKTLPLLPKSNESYSYQLLLTERQAQVITDALDLYARIGSGQLEEISHILRLNPGPAHEKIEAVSRLTREAASCWMGHAGGHHGISSDKIHDCFRIAYDLQQVIRYRLAWDRHPEGGIQVHFDEPMKYSQEPLASIIKA